MNRKNRLFFDTPKRADSSALIYTIVTTTANDVELCPIYARICRAEIDDVLTLLGIKSLLIENIMQRFTFNGLANVQFRYPLQLVYFRHS